MTPQAINDRLRQVLLGLSALTFGMTIAELLLQDHTQVPLQWIPFILCVLGFLAILAFWARPRRQTLQILRAVMVLVVLGSLVGGALHLLGNYNFTIEVRPNATMDEILNGTLKGASPLLAPGILAFAGVLGWLATYYHPVLSEKTNPIEQ